MISNSSHIDQSAIHSLRYLANQMHGCNFALAMRDKEGYLTVYPRENQPCQGGEMRKYGKTHGEKCTRPDDRRPGDLTNPFPDGVVEAVAVRLRVHHDPEMMDFFLSSDSPYKKGFGSSKDVEVLTKDGLVSGLIFKNTDVDPTVLVNFLQFLHYRHDHHPAWKKMIELGATPAETAVHLTLAGGIPGQVSKYDPSQTDPLHMTYSYYFPMKASIRRIIDGNPFDLSGGTYRAGFDYNRPEIQDLFMAREGERETIWYEEVKKRIAPDEKNLKIEGVEQYVEVMKEIISDAYENHKTESEAA